jgi:hypothetical protein
MSKKDFERLAAAMRDARERVAAEPCGLLGALDKVIEELAYACSMSNERFDKARFLAACQYGRE